MYIVRTSILLLPPSIFYLIRRKMQSVRCEYSISLIQSSPVSSRWPRFHLTFMNEIYMYATVRIQLAEYKRYCHVNLTETVFLPHYGVDVSYESFQSYPVLSLHNYLAVPSPYCASRLLVEAL